MLCVYVKELTICVFPKARRVNENSSDALGRYSDRLGPRPKMRSVAYRCVAFMRLKIIYQINVQLRAK